MADVSVFWRLHNNRSFVHVLCQMTASTSVSINVVQPCLRWTQYEVQLKYTRTHRQGSQWIFKTYTGNNMIWFMSYKTYLYAAVDVYQWNICMAWGQKIAPKQEFNARDLKNCNKFVSFVKVFSGNGRGFFISVDLANDGMVGLVGGRSSRHCFWVLICLHFQINEAVYFEAH